MTIALYAAILLIAFSCACLGFALGHKRGELRELRRSKPILDQYIKMRDELFRVEPTFSHFIEHYQTNRECECDICQRIERYFDNLWTYDFNGPTIASLINNANEAWWNYRAH